MVRKVIEGTWEEVAQRARELAGRRVRVTVLDVPTVPERTHADEPGEEIAFDVLSGTGLIGCLKGGPTDLATNPAHMEGLGDE